MTIKEFLATENGARYAAALAGCDERWAVEYYETEQEYTDSLEDNGWNEEAITEQWRAIRADIYKADKTDPDFVIVIN